MSSITPTRSTVFFGSVSNRPTPSSWPPWSASLSGPEIIEALKRSSHTKHVRAVLIADGEADRQAALEAGASAHVSESDLTGLRDTLEALMGVRH